MIDVVVSRQYKGTVTATTTSATTTIMYLLGPSEFPKTNRFNGGKNKKKIQKID